MIFCKSARPFLIRRIGAVFVGLSLMAVPTAALAAHAKAPAQRHRVVRYRGTVLPAIGKDAAIVVDGMSGRTLYERDADALRYPASLTKIMTLYLLFDALANGKMTLDTPLFVSSHASAQEPTKLNVPAGKSIPVETAIKAIVVLSANDIAVAVAEALGGDESGFAELMNKKAYALGMVRTHFHNASGLPDAKQTTTARDLALLGRHIAYDFPQYYPYFAVEAFSYRGRYYGTHNNLLGVFEGTDGIKTGYTHSSGFNLVTSVVRGNAHLIGVVMGSRTAAARDQQMKQLLAIQFTRIEANNTQVMPANVPWQTANAGPKTNPFKGAVAQSLAEGGYQMAMTAPTAVPSDGSSAVPQVASEYRATSASLDQVLNEISMQPIPDSADEDAAETITAPPKRKPVTAPNVRSPSKPVAVPSKVQVASYQASARPTAAAGDASKNAAKPQTPPTLRQTIPVPGQAAGTSKDGDGSPSQAALSTVKAPAVAAGLTGDKRWFVQIGAFADENLAKAQLTAYAAHSMDVLGQAQHLVVPIRNSRGKIIYRARFGVFAENEARELCERMTARGQTCYAALQTD